MAKKLTREQFNKWYDKYKSNPDIRAAFAGISDKDLEGITDEMLKLFEADAAADKAYAAHATGNLTYKSNDKDSDSLSGEERYAADADKITVDKLKSAIELTKKLKTAFDKASKDIQQKQSSQKTKVALARKLVEEKKALEEKIRLYAAALEDKDDTYELETLLEVSNKISASIGELSESTQKNLARKSKSKFKQAHGAKTSLPATSQPGFTISSTHMGVKTKKYQEVQASKRKNAIKQQKKNEESYRKEEQIRDELRKLEEVKKAAANAKVEAEKAAKDNRRKAFKDTFVGKSEQDIEKRIAKIKSEIEKANKLDIKIWDDPKAKNRTVKINNRLVALEKQRRSFAQKHFYDAPVDLNDEKAWEEFKSAGQHRTKVSYTEDERKSFFDPLIAEEKALKQEMNDLTKSHYKSNPALEEFIAKKEDLSLEKEAAEEILKERIRAQQEAAEALKKPRKRKKEVNWNSNIDAEALPVKLDTSIGNRNGKNYRNHEYKITDPKLAEKFGKDTIYTVTELTGEFAPKFQGEGGKGAAAFGTTVHKVIEDLEKGAFGDLKTGKELQDEEIKKYVERALASGNAEEIADMEGVTHGFNQFGEKYKFKDSAYNAKIAEVAARVNDYLRLKDSMGLGDQQATSSEKELGARLTLPNGKTIKIAGTLDQIFGAMITDLKTSNQVGPEYGMQIALLKMLASVNNINLDETGRIIHIPRDKEKSPELVDVDSMQTSKLLQLIDLSLKLKEEKDPKKKEKLLKQGLSMLGSGGLSTVVTEGEYTDKKTKQTYPLTRLNGLTLKEWSKRYRKMGLSDKDIAAQLRNLINNIPSLLEKNKLIFGISNDPYGTYSDAANNGVFDELRTFPEFNNKEIYLGYVRDQSGEGVVDANIIGNASTNGWIRAISNADPEKRAKIIHNLISIFEERLRGESTNPSSAEAENNQLAFSRLLSFLGLFTHNPDSGYGPISGVSTEDMDKALIDIETDFGKSPVLGPILTQLKEEDNPQKVWGNIFPNSSAITGKISADLGEFRAIKDKEDEYYTGSKSEQKLFDPVQIANKFAYMYESVPMYDEVYKQLWEEFNSTHDDSKYTGEDGYKLFIEDAMSPAQLAQYKAVQRLRDFIQPLLNGNASWSDVLYELGAQSYNQKGWTEETSGEYGPLYSLLENLAGLYHDYGKTKGIFYDKDFVKSLMVQLYNNYEKKTLDDLDLEEPENQHVKSRTLRGQTKGSINPLAMPYTIYHGNDIGRMFTYKTEEEAQEWSKLTGGSYKPEQVQDLVINEAEKADTTDTEAAEFRREHGEVEPQYYIYVDDPDREEEYVCAKEGPKKNFAWCRLDFKTNSQAPWSPGLYFYESDELLAPGTLVKAPLGGSYAKRFPDAQFILGKVEISENITEYEARHRSVSRSRTRRPYTGQIKKLLGIYMGEDTNPESDKKAAAGSTSTPSAAAPSKEVSSAGTADAFNPYTDTVKTTIDPGAGGSLYGDTAYSSTNSSTSGESESTTSAAPPASSGAKTDTGTGTPAYGVYNDKSKNTIVENVEKATVKAGTIDVHHLETMNQTVSNNGSSAGGSGGGRSKKSGRPAEDVSALEVESEEEVDKYLKKIQRAYDSILNIDTKIIKNKEQITKLEKENTEQSNTYADNLKKENALLEEQKQGHQKLINDAKNSGTSGIDIMEKNHNVKEALMMSQFAYARSKEEQKSSSSKGGSSFGGGAAARRASYYSLDGRIVWWFERMLNGGLLMSFFNILKKGLTTAIGLAKELDKSITNIRIVTGTTITNAQQLTSQFINLSSTLGATAQEVLNAATEFYRQGYQTADVLTLVESATKLSKLGMIDMNKSVKDLTSAIKGFKLSTAESIDVVDKLTAIDMQAAVSAGEIAEGLSQFANLASVNGVDLDQAAAYVATIAEVTQNGGSAVGSSLKMIMSRYGNVKAGAYNKLNVDTENTDTSQDLNDVEKILKKLGISIRDANLNFKDFDVIIDEIAERWNDLDNVTKRAISTAFAGTRQQEAFLTLMENYDKYKTNLEVSQNSEGTADEKYKSYQESYEAAKNSLDDAIKALVNSSEINKILTDSTQFLTKIVEKVLPIAIKILPGLLHAFEDIKALFGKSLVQNVASGISNFGENGKNIFGRSTIGWKNNGSFMGNMAARRAARKESEVSQKEAKEIAATDQFTESIRESSESMNEYNTATQDITSATTQLTNTETQYGAAVENNTISEKEETMANEGAVTSETSENAANYAAAYSEMGETTANYTVTSSEYKEAAANEQSAASEGGYSAGNTNGAQGTGQGVNNFSAIMTGISILATSLSSAIVAYNTAASTHTYNGKSVESSEAAQKAGGTIAGILAAIPFGIGTIIDSIFGISEKVAASVDAERDMVNAAADGASELLDKLDSIDTNIEAIGNTEFGSKEFNEAIDDLLTSLYDSDNKSLRDTLDLYLGGSGSLYKTIQEIKKGNENSLKEYKKLQIAQLEAKKAQIGDKYSTQQYEISNTIGEKYSKFSDYQAKGNVTKAIGTTAAAGAAGALAGATGGLIIAGASNGWNPVGWGLLIAGAVTGLLLGGVAAYQNWEEEKLIDEEKHARESAWNVKTNSEKIQEVRDQIEEWRADTQANHEESIKNAEELLNALQEQKALTNKIIDEKNDIVFQQSLIGAQYNEDYIQDMSVSQLKSLGIDKILTAFGESAVNYGLIGQRLFNDEGELTDAAYDYLLTELKSLEDEEINAVLSGYSYTLEEALKMRDVLGNTKQVTRLLQSFADSLGITVDQLEDVEEKFGMLTLAETYLSAAEITDKTSEYTSLLDSIASGSGSVSEWMNTIVNQFPELIAYMSDIPTLFQKITKKIEGLSNQYLQAQYDSVAASTDTYDTIKDKFYSNLHNSELEALLDKENITSISGVTEWLKTQYREGGSLTNEGKEVLDALTETIDQYGLSVTSQVLKAYYDQIINFKTQTLDMEINNLNDQVEALQNINKQREYENQLIEAKLKLENASKEKKRVYRAGVGWVYESDQESILSAQKEVEELQNQKTVSALQEEIAELERQKTELGSIYDQQNYETLSKLYNEFVSENGFASTAEGLYQQIVTGINGISKSVSEILKENSATDAETKTAAIKEAAQAWTDLLLTPTTNVDAYNTALENYHTKMDTAVKAGMTQEEFKSYLANEKTIVNPKATGKFGNILTQKEATETGSHWSGHTTTSNGTTDAWETYKGDLKDQKYDKKFKFVLPTTSDSVDLSGYTSLESAFDESVLANSLLQYIQAGGGHMWIKGGESFFDPNSKMSTSSEGYTGLSAYLNKLKENGYTEFVLSGYSENGDDNISIYVDSSGQAHAIHSDEHVNGLGGIVKGSEEYQFAAAVDGEANALGTLSFGGGNALINELGTEAIITPQGTITALPSKTGIVPADVTKNLWALGDVAPSIMRTLENIWVRDPRFTGVGASTDESFNIGTINMTVDADSTFDVDDFVESIKTRAALTRNTNR